jgi:hypothetical protein
VWKRPKEDGVRVRNAWLVGLVIALVMTALVVVACGGSGEDDKAALSAALDKVETSIAGFQKMGADSTVADIIAARDAVGPDWAEVVAAAKNVEGADPAAAEKAWTDVNTAVDSIPEGASLLQAAALIMGPVQTLLKAESDLRTLVPKAK